MFCKSYDFVSESAGMQTMRAIQPVTLITTREMAQTFANNDDALVLGKTDMTQCCLMLFVRWWCRYCCEGFSSKTASNGGYVDRHGCNRFDFARACTCGKNI